MKIGKVMCKQMDVLKKIRQKGKINGYEVELAEAQAEDYVRMKKRIAKIESDVGTVKTNQAVMNGKLDLILTRLDGPAEQERKDGIFWSEIKSILKTKAGKVFCLLFLLIVGVAGERIYEIIRTIIEHWA